MFNQSRPNRLSLRKGAVQFLSHQQRRVRKRSIFSAFASIAVLYFVWTVTEKVFFIEESSSSSECWLQHAFHSGSFHIFSHRSFFDKEKNAIKALSETSITTCKEALIKLKSIKVNHIDIDVVLDIDKTGNKNHSLKVAHPVEFKQTSAYYSPCANQELDVFLQTMHYVFNDKDGQNYFVSMEPKAAWKRTQKESDDEALAPPIMVLQSLKASIDKAKEFVGSENTKQRYAVIMDPNLLQGREENDLFLDLKRRCQLFIGYRMSDNVAADLSIYDGIMPSIEFHPKYIHHHHSLQEHDSMKTLEQAREKSIYWIVDNEEDLKLTAALRPLALVSNRPEHIVSLIENESFC
mmetsp:Transcript_3768/g.5628  ORF Transcript_3768/g.5628 Transcript_3768/m.5628 type:complete len:350 (-) Transcript_3768:40-1089(-)